MYPIKQEHWDRYRHAVLDHGLNVAVLVIARQLLPGGFDVSEDAPETYNALVRQFESGQRYIVYAGGSENTVFGDPEVNYHFRAWHDWCHWKGKHDFSFQGEHATYLMQCEHLVELYGNDETTERWRRILFADVIGQKLYFHRYRCFPENQMEFVKQYLARQAANVLSTSLGGVVESAHVTASV